MAFAAEKWQVSLDSLDKGANVSTKTYDLQATDDAEAATEAAAFVALYAATTACFVPRYVVHRVMEDNLIVGTPTSDLAMNSVQAIITGALATSPFKRASIVINGPKEAVFVSPSGPNRDVVNIAQDDVAALIVAFKGGEQVYLSDGENYALLPNAEGIRRTVYRRLAK